VNVEEFVNGIQKPINGKGNSFGHCKTLSRPCKRNIFKQYFSRQSEGFTTALTGQQFMPFFY